MAGKTAHILPSGDGWVIKRESDRVVVKKRLEQKVSGSSGKERAMKVFPTQAAAIERAKQLVGKADRDGQRVKRSAAGQIVVHGRNGSVQWRATYGLPTVKTPPKKSELGTKAIKKAVSTVIRERLERE